MRAGRIYASAVVMTTLRKSFLLTMALYIVLSFHVVCEKRITIKAGSEVRCMDGEKRARSRRGLRGEEYKLL